MQAAAEGAVMMQEVIEQDDEHTEDEHEDERDAKHADDNENSIQLAF